MNEPEATPWVLMGILALALLTYPLIAIFNHRTLVLGVPVILVYLFGIWGALIGLSTRYPPRG